jgi:type II secretory pathway pseudopilin PulG
MKNKHLWHRAARTKGISLIEVTIIIITVGILASLAMRSLTSILKDSKTVETEREMDMLAKAIAGDPSIMAVAGGVRSDFGYVGDVGALPDDLEDLVTSPGYGTWNGPYLPPDFNRETDDYKKDAWGTDYSYSGGVIITSTGSGSDIVKRFAENVSDLLANEVTGIIRDANDSLASADYTADLDIIIIYPNGTGGLDTVTCHPADTGWFTFTSIPIGKHLLHAVYTPDADTLTRYATVTPRQSSVHPIRFKFDSGYFLPEEGGPSGLTLAAGSDTAYSTLGGSCNNVRFWIENATGSPIQIDWIKLEYSTLDYYQTLNYDGGEEFDEASPRNGSGDTVTFAATRTVPVAATKLVEVETFKDTRLGSGNNSNMSSTTFTVTFSDGSTFDVTFDYCE